jgi:hypothetical protein
VQREDKVYKVLADLEADEWKDFREQEKENNKSSSEANGDDLDDSARTQDHALRGNNPRKKVTSEAVQGGGKKRKMYAIVCPSCF